MSNAGRPAKPTHLKVLHGDQPSRINRNEPQPAETEIVPPWPLTKAAQEHWDRMAPDRIAKGVLTAWDVEAFAQFCEALAIARQKMSSARQRPKPGMASPVSEFARVMQIVSSLGGRFGWTPSDRAKLTVGEEKVDVKERFGS
jgi:phage terminase small subunit